MDPRLSFVEQVFTARSCPWSQLSAFNPLLVAPSRSEGGSHSRVNQVDADVLLWASELGNRCHSSPSVESRPLVEKSQVQPDDAR